MKNTKNITPDLIGFYRGIVTQINSVLESDLKKTLENANIKVEWNAIASDTAVEYASISIPVQFDQGNFTPKVNKFAHDDFRKLLKKSFKAQSGMLLKSQNLDAYLIRRKEFKNTAYIVSIGSPIVGAALNSILLKEIEISYKKINLRGLCEYLFKDPSFSALTIRRLNLELSGRENPATVSKCSIIGPDVFSSNFFCDLIGMSTDDRRDEFSPFTKDRAAKRSLWNLEPMSCQVRLKNDGNSSFWLNLDRYGNFIFPFRVKDDLLRVAETLMLLEQLTDLIDSGNPLKREIVKVEE